MRSDRSYIAIDLKSFYASVECRERGLDPLTANLVVADPSRTEKTICLAVSPSLKAYGIGGRARLFEVVQRVREVNADRLRVLRRGRGRRKPSGASADCGSRERPACEPGAGDGSVSDSFPASFPADLAGCTRRGIALEAYHPFEGTLFTGASYCDDEVRRNPCLELDYLVAKPRMALYLEYSARIYGIYLRYIAPEDIHVYSIDEVFIDATDYLRAHGTDASGLASRMVRDIYEATGITATAGVGTNLYLAKVAMDILAKHEEPDANGVRIAVLDERSYKERLWGHRPLTDFWRIGRGYAAKLAAQGIETMGDIARCSLGAPGDRWNEELLFKLFGKNAELLIDHAWGWEPVTMAQVKAYRPQAASTVSGQVLQRPYGFDEARLVVWEMADQLALDLTAARMETDKLVLTVGYDREGAPGEGSSSYRGPMTEDFYGRKVPKAAHGTGNLAEPTASSHRLTQAALELYDRLVDPVLCVRRISIAAENLVGEDEAERQRRCGQMSLFDEPPDPHLQAEMEREKRIQGTMLGIRNRFGKNAILKAPSLQDGATARQRNGQIGGHSA